LSVQKGKVYLVGAGPGDPALITLKGVECLRQAQCIIYDYLASKELLEHAADNAEIIYVGKQAGSHAMSQEDINALLIDRGRHQVVVRLKGGDPFMFGRGGEEAQALARAGISFEVVPGVTSAIAVPAYAGIPLTHRRHSSSVAFVTGHEMAGKEDSDIHWPELATGVGTLVFLMGVKNLEHIAARLLAGGREPGTPVAVIRWGSTGKQQTVTGSLADISEIASASGIRPPAIIVVGEVVQLRSELNWFEQRPLYGRTLVITRAREQASEFKRLLENLGAQCVEFPTIKVVPPDTWAPVDEAIKALPQHHWVLFTSVNGVGYFFERLSQLGEDVRALYRRKIGAIGPKTAAALSSRGLRLDLVPAEYRAEAVVEELGEEEIRGRRFLLPRAARAREVLPERLRQLGGQVTVVPVYQTIRPGQQVAEVRQLLREGTVDCLTFTSSSTVENFAAMFPGENMAALVGETMVACIGPITAETARKHGLQAGVVPDDYTIEGLAGAIVDYFSKS